MANRTTVNISLTPELNSFIQTRVESGRYQTASEVVREGLRLLERQERSREDEVSALKARLERAAAQEQLGELLDGEEVMEELTRMLKERASARKKALRK